MIEAQRIGGGMLFGGRRWLLEPTKQVRGVLRLNVTENESGVCSALDVSLSEIVQKLMKRFSSSEGYKAFEDAIPNGLPLSIRIFF